MVLTLCFKTPERRFNLTS